MSPSGREVSTAGGEVSTAGGEVSTAKTQELELVVDARADVGESPLWDARARRLWWIDMLVGELHAYDVEAGPAEPIHFDRALGFIVPSCDGGLVAGAQGGIARIDGARLETIAPIEADRAGYRMNDGKCDPQGRIWAGTMSDGARVGGCLYRVDPDRQVTLVRSDLHVPNGLAWTSDCDLMYVTDSDPRRIEVWRFDPGTGRPVELARVIEVEQGVGTPDGMTIDEEDCIWVALWGGGRVRRYSPEGDVLAEIAVPSTLTTSCAFGGDDLRDLYITTARYRLDAAQLVHEPLAGGLFRCRPGARGLEADAYVA